MRLGIIYDEIAPDVVGLRCGPAVDRTRSICPDQIGAAAVGVACGRAAARPYQQPSVGSSTER
jgi:hypothetical protein